MIIIITAVCRGRQLLFHLGLVSFLHAALSFTFRCQELLSISSFFRFLLIVSLNLSLGLPWLRLPLHNCEWSSCLGKRWWSILSTWPSHLRFICISRQSKFQYRTIEKPVLSLCTLCISHEQTRVSLSSFRTQNLLFPLWEIVHPPALHSLKQYSEVLESLTLD